jgi:hypothetical protein
MVSKMVTDRQKLSKDLIAWAVTHAPAIEKALLAKLHKPTMTADGMILLARHVDAGLGALVLADEAHTSEQADDEIPRRDRDAARDEVSNFLVGFRRAVEASHGRPGLLALGIHEKLGRDPIYLERLGTRIVEKASAAGFQMPPSDPDVTVDVPSRVAKLKVVLAKLSAALETVDKEAAELTTTQTEKAAAMATFDGLLGGTTTTFRGLAAVAGLRELADGLPTLNRGAGGAGGEEEGGEEEVMEDGPRDEGVGTP